VAPPAVGLQSEARPLRSNTAEAAPGELIGQINFSYPPDVTSTTPYVEGSLTIGGVTGYFRVPAPSGP
jgi:hypothetical protein